MQDYLNHQFIDCINGAFAFGLFPNLANMMKQLFFTVALLAPGSLWAQDAFETPYERSKGKQTTTYAEAIDYYTRLSKEYSSLHMIEMGKTDSGFPLHLVVFSPTNHVDFDRLHAEGYTVLLVNNGIHAGESDGVDASMMLMRDLVSLKQGPGILDSTVIAVVPFYNIGGALNRNSTTRFNQNGPEEYGFRGNGRNFDLNRDFIKADTRNARSFQELFHQVDPDLFLDTHVTNGSDHQYTLTLLTTLPEQLGDPLASFLNETIEPQIFKSMANRSHPITPYVNVHGRTPDNGWTRFYDSPRYSSGFTSLFQTVGFMSEAHSLKPYDVRVQDTYMLLQTLLEVARDHGKSLQTARKEARAALPQQSEYVLAWKVAEDATPDTLNFMGYESVTKTGSLTGAETYDYDHNQPYTKPIPIRNAYTPAITVKAPVGYYVPAGWWNVLEQLKRNGVKVEEVRETMQVAVEVYHIADYGTYEMPYEGHYPHYNVQLETTRETITIYPGDYYVPLNQAQNKYIVHVLEPQSRDSFFSWNFFDTILQQKEGPSGYMLERRVEELKAAVPNWESKWEVVLEENPEWKEQPQRLMYWLYQEGFQEKNYLRYPIYRATK